jgi:hypothetical protein
MKQAYLKVGYKFESQKSGLRLLIKFFDLACHGCLCFVRSILNNLSYYLKLKKEQAWEAK